MIFIILVPAAIVLWLRPGSTADEWSWAIKPSLSAIFLGSGYAAGAYFFMRTFLAYRWPPSSAGVFGAAFFAALMLIATLLHWDKFNHGDAPTVAAIAFYGWVSVYILSPFAVGALWLPTAAPTPASRSRASRWCPTARGSRRGCSRWGRSARRSCSSCSRAPRSTSGRGSSRP